MSNDLQLSLVMFENRILEEEEENDIVKTSGESKTSTMMASTSIAKRDLKKLKLNCSDSYVSDVKLQKYVRRSLSLSPVSSSKLSLNEIPENQVVLYFNDIVDQALSNATDLYEGLLPKKKKNQ
jgi:hypothetical protein